MAFEDANGPHSTPEGRIELDRRIKDDDPGLRDVGPETWAGGPSDEDARAGPGV